MWRSQRKWKGKALQKLRFNKSNQIDTIIKILLRKEPMFHHLSYSCLKLPQVVERRSSLAQLQVDIGSASTASMDNTCQMTPA